MTESAAPEQVSVAHVLSEGPAADSGAAVGNVAAAPIAIPGLAIRRAGKGTSGAATPPVSNPDPVENFQLMWKGGPDDVGIAVIYTRDWNALSADDQAQLKGFMTWVDRKMGFGDVGVRVSPSDAYEKLSVKYLTLAREHWKEIFGPDSLDGKHLGHAPDKTAGGRPIEDLVALPSSENTSQGKQWARYKEGFTFAGVSLYDEATGKWITSSGALYDEPPDPRSLPGYRKPRPKRSKIKKSQPENAAGQADEPSVEQSVGEASAAFGPHGKVGTKSASLNEATGGLSKGETAALAESAKGDVPSGADATMHKVGTAVSVGTALVSAVLTIKSAAESMATAEHVLAGGEFFGDHELAQLQSLAASCGASLREFTDYDRGMALLASPGGELWQGARDPHRAAELSRQLKDMLDKLRNARDKHADLLRQVRSLAGQAKAKRDVGAQLVDDPATKAVMAAATESEDSQVAGLQAYEVQGKAYSILNNAATSEAATLEVIGRSIDTLEPWLQSLSDTATRGWIEEVKAGMGAPSSSADGQAPHPTAGLANSLSR